jgi:signal transduction histidine kinase
MQILAHDLRSPFNSLLGFSDLLLENIHQYKIDEIEKLILIINQTAFRTYNLLDDLLLWSKSQAGKFTFEPESIYVQEKCNEIIYQLRNQADKKNISINYTGQIEVTIKADLNMFKTILRNLISNAIKFTNENGAIAVKSEKQAQNAIITISDNGIGIKKEDQDKLWCISEQFTKTGTVSEKGSGLGLLLCKEFVEKHGGHIWVESLPGKGSNFIFTMPLLAD